MSENEQKAGCVEDEDGLPVGYAAWYNARYNGQPCDTQRDHACEAAWRAAIDFTVAALEAAALSPARSGEAELAAFDAGWRVCVEWTRDRDDLLADMDSPAYRRDRIAALKGKYRGRLSSSAELLADREQDEVIAPRNESSGVSPGGDRRVLVDALENLDNSAWECPRCGHTDDCATMDVAHMIRQHLATPAPQDSVRVGDGMRELAANTGTLAVAAFLTGELATPAPAAGADGLRDTRKVCTCEGRQSCGVLAGNQLGDLWRCALGHENRPLSDGAGQSSGGG